MQQKQRYKCYTALYEILSSPNVELLIADLSSRDGIRALAEQYLSKYDALHVLINNAGGLFKKHEKNEEGMEMTIALNYIAPFLLTQLLLETLKKSAPARIVNVASDKQAESLDLEQMFNPNKYNAMEVYRNAKLAVVMSTYTIARQLSDTGVTANALHPGVIYTPQSARMAPSFARPLVKLFMSSPEKGAKPSLRLAKDPDLAGVTGQYFKKFSQKQTGTFSYNIDQQEKLYEHSLVWSGLK